MQISFLEADLRVGSVPGSNLYFCGDPASVFHSLCHTVRKMETLRGLEKKAVTQIVRSIIVGKSAAGGDREKHHISTFPFSFGTIERCHVSCHKFLQALFCHHKKEVQGVFCANIMSKQLLCSGRKST